MLEQRLYFSQLLDIYGPLLTEKQRKCLEMHLLEDFSMSEIGESLQVSRQAVYDILHRSQQTLAEYESNLGLAKRMERQRDDLTEIYELLKGAHDKADFSQLRASVLKKLLPYTNLLREEYD